MQNEKKLFETFNRTWFYILYSYFRQLYSPPLSGKINFLSGNQYIPFLMSTKRTFALTIINFNTLNMQLIMTVASLIKQKVVKKKKKTLR